MMLLLIVSPAVSKRKGQTQSARFPLACCVPHTAPAQGFSQRGTSELAWNRYHIMRDHIVLNAPQCAIFHGFILVWRVGVWEHGDVPSCPYVRAHLHTHVQ
jgi:hypothetical protein